MYSLESRLVDAILMSTLNIFFNVKYEKIRKLSLNLCHLDILGIYYGLQGEFGTAIVNEA